MTDAACSAGPLGEFRIPIVRMPQRDLQVGERRAAVQAVLDSVQHSCVSEPGRTRSARSSIKVKRNSNPASIARVRSESSRKFSSSMSFCTVGDVAIACR